MLKNIIIICLAGVLTVVLLTEKTTVNEKVVIQEKRVFITDECVNVGKKITTEEFCIGTDYKGNGCDAWLKWQNSKN